MKKGINVLSLFNGMGTLRQAFADLGIDVRKYYSSEIKPYAIKLQQHHFPEVIQVGDINNWKEWDINWKTIDFIGSGSPCQDLSLAGKRKGVVAGERSKLFFTFVEILNYVKKRNPNVVFLQENVGSADKKDIGIMSRALGVIPCLIDSQLLTAQMRKRYYWTNIRTKKLLFGYRVEIPQPEDLKIKLQNVITEGFADRVKAAALLESEGGNYKNKKALYRRYCRHSFITVVFDNPRFLFNENLRELNKIELCRLQGFPDDYCGILSHLHSGSLLGDGWTLPVIKHIVSFYKYKPIIINK